MSDSGGTESADEETLHQLNTLETFSHTGHSCQAKNKEQTKKNHVSFSSESDVPDCILLKAVYHKRTFGLRKQDSFVFEGDLPRGCAKNIGHVGEDSKKPSVGVCLDGQEHLINSVRGVNRSQHPRRVWDNQWQLLQDKVHLQDKLLRTGNNLRKIIQSSKDETKSEEENADRGRARQAKEIRVARMPSSGDWRREPPVRGRDVTRRTQENVRNAFERKQDNWNTHRRETAAQKEEATDHGTRVYGEPNRMLTEGFKVKEFSRGKERSDKNIRLSAKTREESQWSQARAKEEEQCKLSEEKTRVNAEKRQGRSLAGRHASGVDEREQALLNVGQQRSVRGQAAEQHSGEEKQKSLQLMAGSRPSFSQSSRPQLTEEFSEEQADTSPQLLSCKFCQRRFTPARFDKHMNICEKLHQSQRKVFDSSSHRAKGTVLEEFMKNRRRKSPEVKSTRRQRHEEPITNMQQDCLPRGAQQSNQFIGNNSTNYVTCPHCSRRFAPRPAERHIPNCENIKSRPPPPCYRQ